MIGMNTTTMPANEVFESYTMDYTAKVHFAVRADGQWYKRVQVRDPRYGYRFTAWRACTTPDLSADGRPMIRTGRKARLPHAA